MTQSDRKSSNGAALRVLVLGPLGAHRARGLQEFAVGAGWEVHVLPRHEPLPADPGLEPSGVVVFDSDESGTAAWLAQIRGCTRYLEVPLVAVARGPLQEAQAKLMGAGASVVCPADASYETILKEIETRTKLLDVLSEIRDRLLVHFGTATSLTFREMARLEIHIRSTYQKSGYKMFGDISAVLSLTGLSQGTMVLSFPESTAVAVARRILSDLPDPPGDDLVRDCVGEIANVIVGQARGALANTPYQFGMSTPTVVSGAGHEIRHKPGMRCLVLAFGSEIGDFALQLCMSV